MVNDCRMGAFGVVLRQLATIETFPLRQVIFNVSFLQQRVARIFLVLQDTAHSFSLPFAAQPAGNALFAQLLRDSPLSHAVQAGSEDGSERSQPPARQ